MIKSINSKYSIILSAIVMLVFFAFAVNSANAQYFPFGSPIGNNYGYNIPNPPPPPQPPMLPPPPPQPPRPAPVVINQPVVYVQTPSYNYNYSYPNLSVSCSANANYSYNGAVTWTAYVTGGSGSYTYRWSGTDGLYGSNQSVYFTYNTAGTKTASVTVYSGNQTVTQYCSNTVNVNYGYNQQYYYPVNNYGNLDIGCFADPINAKTNQPVSWNVEVTGGIAPYTYSWTGSDGLYGSQSSIIKYYSTAGSKNAIVTVTSADGRTGTRACGNTVTISAYAKAAVVSPVEKVVTTPVVEKTVSVASPVTEVQPTSLTAASLFSLENVPWGWVAILVIIVLLFTVFYLVFNRKNI